MKNLKSIIALLVLTVFSVNLWGETYTKATSLKAGDEIVLVCEAKSMELTSISTTSTKYGIGTSYTTSVVGTYVFEVVAGSETNSFSFKTGSNYLRWNSGNSLDVVATSVAKNSSWSVTFDTDGNATIKNANDETRVIWWNVSSPRFACYTDKSDGNDYKYVQLYKKAPSTFSVTYNANGATSGTVPTDATAYTSGATVTVKGNTGNLVKMNKKFGGWNTNQSGTGTNYAENATFSITANTTLYAKWNDITFTDYITECSSDPEISVSSDAVEGLGYVYGSAASESIVKDFTVVGGNLSQKVTVTAPAGFEVKQEGGNFDDEIELTPAEGLLNKIISVRLSSGKTAGNYEGEITISSTEVDDKTVVLSATVTPAPLATPEVTATPAVHQITLSWEAVPNASSYQLSWDGGTPETVTTLSVVKDGLTGGQSYSYSLIAVGTGNYSNSETAASSAIAGKETYTVKFFNSGSELTELEKHIEEGATFGTLPTLTESCDPKSTTFVGWTREEAWGGKVASFDNFVTSSTSVNAAMILNAVWAEGGINYARVTDVNQLADGQNIIIQDNSHLLLNTIGNGSVLTETDNKVTPTNDNQIWKLVKDEDDWGFVGANNKKVFVTDKTDDLTFTSDGSNEYYYWTIKESTYSSDYFWIYLEGTSSNYYWEYNNKWLTYSISNNPSSGQDGYIKQRLYVNSLTNYITTCSTDPLIEVSTESLNGFSTIATAGPSAAQSFTVEGYNLTENISVSAPAGYEVSSDNSNYSNSLSLTQTDGKVAKTTVYVRLAAAEVAVASVEGNISLASSGVNKSIALSGTVLAKTLQSISVKTAPTKTTYTIDEKFNPAGLVITATYNSGDEEVAYAGNESEFTFNPTLETALTASDNKVTITWEGQSKDQSITMQCNVAWQVNGQPWTAGTPTTLVNVGSAITEMPTDPTSEACNGKTFVGWSASTFAKTDNPPTLLTKVADFTTLNAHTIYHAVFAKASEGGSGVKSKSWSFGNATDRNDWTASSTAEYFSTYYGFKNGSATIKKYDIEDFKNYAAFATNITIGLTSFQNGGTTTVLTIILVDKDGNEIGTGKDITPVNGSATSAATEQTVTFSATAGATGYKIKCKTHDKNTLVSASRYEITYTEVAYSEYSTTCTPVHDVKFYTDKEKSVLYATKKVEEGSKATAPETEPSKAGATFAGWFTANDEALADKTITEATDFIAKWNYTAPTITEQPQGGEYTIGSVVTLVVVAEPITDVTFTYQWQRWNGSEYEDIAGATIYAYTAPTNQESQNTYRCVVTNGDASTPSAPAQVTVRPASYCAMPTIRIDELGEATAFIREATVTMECGNEGATIYYTLDGSDPKEVGASPETYTVPFKIDATKTIKAYATATDLESSSVQTKTFTKATLQSIAVKTAPTKTEYTALETFIPAGLAITANYDYSLSEEIDYANHSGEFTFTPTLTTELGVDVKAVKISWGGKETDLDITVNCIAIEVPNVEESKQGSTGITLTWSAIDHAASYQVKWNGGDAETPTYNTELSKYEFVKTGLTAYTPYTYEVIAIGNTNYCTSTTGVQNVTTNKKSCVSIDNAQIVKTPADFYVGESIEKSQFKVDKHYDNGDVVTEAPSNAEIEGVTNPLTDAEVGTQTVTLTFNSKTTTIEITVKPQPVVTWSINGNEDNKQSFAYNAALVLPEAPAAPQTCAEKTFVGWTTETYKDYDSDDAPAVLFTEAGDRKVTEDVTYYAVFAMVENAEINTVLTEVFDDNQTTDSNSEFDKNTFSNFNGNCSKAYKSKYGGIKLGSGSALGYITSKELDLSKPTTIAFDVKQYDEDEKSVTVTIVNNENQSESVSKSYSCTTDELETAVLNFDASYTKAVVKITTTSSSHRIYVDNVKIEVGGEIISSAYSTKCAARTPKSIEITAEATKTFDVNDPFTYEGLEITASYNTGDPQVVTDYCEITAPDMTTANEKDVNISYTENDVTVYISYKINVRQPYYVMYESNGATTGTVPSDTKKYYTGEKVTVLANESLVKTDNVFKGWSYAGVTYQADDQITVGTENITLTAVWEEKVPCTITLSENGNLSTVTDKFTGDNYTLPATITYNVDGYAFMGWSIQEINEPVATTEQGTFFAKGEEITLINNAYTFYAVYARTSGTSSDYNAGKVTTSADIVAGGLYIIEQAGHVLSSPAAEKKAPTEATYKTSGLSATESYVWTLETSTNGFYLKNMSDNKYLKENGGDMSSVTSNMSEWKFAFQTAGYWKISSADDRYLGFNGSNTYLYKAYANTHYDLTLVNVQYAAQINIYRLVGGYTTVPTIVVNGKTVTEVPATFHGNVIVEDVGNVTLNAATTWKNLTIKNGAKVTTKAALSINNLLIETKMGAGTGKKTSPNSPASCGQLIIGDGGSVTASGSAIIENQIDPTGTATQGWYSFSVPFPVSAQNGIYFGDAKLTNGVDYAIMEYLGDVRAQGQYGWKKYSGILQPGKMYVIAVTDSDFGKLRFKKTADGALISTNSWTAGIYGGGEATDANWNAIGNPNLAIAQFVNNSGAGTLQFYDHANNTFTVHEKGDLNIVVGSGFFIQAVADYPNITMKVAEGDRGYRAPAEDIEEMPFVAIQLLQGDAMSDQVFLNADVNATLSYEIGRDVAKFFMQGEAKCAQIYVPAYGTNLCVAQFPLNAYDETMFPLTITAPKEGTYTIAAENVPENVDLFLEQNGALIWNLSNSAYEINLNKGETKDYSIRWNAHSSSTPTGNNSIKSDAKVQKIFYQQNIYIIQENQMYNAQGIKVQ